LDEVAVHVDHKALMEVDDSVLIVGDLQGILGWQTKPHSVHLLNVYII
jgi:hypothetical protein